MGKVLFVLELPEPKLRKEHAPPSKRHKDATKYSRKQKHKARRDEAPDSSGASFFPGMAGTCARGGFPPASVIFFQADSRPIC